jgi:carotenoid cleavage dioxygenase-like enzyme
MSRLFNPDRRSLIGAGAALMALPLTPEAAVAAASAKAAADWNIAFADLEADVPPQAMTLVHGKPPEGLAGTLYRNGGAKFRRPKGDATHWFDGDGLIRVFRVGDGKATLAARYVDTPKRRADTAANAVISGGFGTLPGPGAHIASPDDVSGANISIIRRGSALWALWEAGSPFGIDPKTLATTGIVTLRDDLAHMPFLAHPRFEPDGRLWNLGQLGDKLVVWQVAASGDLIAVTPIELPRASYIHDFTMTDRHLVIVLQPWVYETPSAVPLVALKWRPALGTQVLILDKTDLSSRRIVELPSFFAFHMTSARETPSGEISFEICASPEPDFATKTAVDALKGVYTPPSLSRLAIVTLPASGPARLEITGIEAEFPRTDNRVGGRHNLTLHAAGQSKDRPLFQGIGVYDRRTQKDASFDFGPGHLVEEMVFTPRPGSTAEFDGWIIGPTINLRAGRTELHVFDAQHVADGPIATWRADLAIPAGLHGMFWPA